eukprot:CAMPEP_0182852186 /NCGR_PEP_ID=MMETSP0034_2-20130328/29_1 /TAXON_ID=156128 /ORGANISM="Nephroselmis pyriformis, Strain CCMP717" /LENGTH=200 /DNA_ID=CAMNT_0024982881 /DNA_START=26 /DNA_END=630 /DNA_ORIENTATION=+
MKHQLVRIFLNEIVTDHVFDADGPAPPARSRGKLARYPTGPAARPGGPLHAPAAPCCPLRRGAARSSRSHAGAPRSSSLGLGGAPGEEAIECPDLEPALAARAAPRGAAAAPRGGVRLLALAWGWGWRAAWGWGWRAAGGWGGVSGAGEGESSGASRLEVAPPDPAGHQPRALPSLGGDLRPRKAPLSQTYLLPGLEGGK